LEVVAELLDMLNFLSVFKLTLNISLCSLNEPVNTKKLPDK